MRLKCIPCGLAILALAGCSYLGMTEEEQPGIGSGIDDYKRSPCACLEIELEGEDGWKKLLPGAVG